MMMRYDDVHTTARLPSLQICQKRSGAAIDDDDVQGSDDLADEGAGSTSQGTVKATFAQVKSKVLCCNGRVGPIVHS